MDENNPYKSPSSQVEDQIPQPVNWLRGIFLGAAVDIGGTIIGVSIISLFFQYTWINGGLDSEQVIEKFAEMSAFSFPNVIATLWGLAMSFLGGYVCVMASHTRTYHLPLVLAALGLLYSLLGAPGSTDFLLVLVLSLVAVNCTLYGAKTALLKRAP